MVCSSSVAGLLWYPSASASQCSANCLIAKAVVIDVVSLIVTRVRLRCLHLMSEQSAKGVIMCACADELGNSGVAGVA